jgi:histidinol-phosphatase
VVGDVALVVGDDPLGDSRERLDFDLDAGLLTDLAGDRLAQALAPLDASARKRPQVPRGLPISFDEKQLTPLQHNGADGALRSLYGHGRSLTYDAFPMPYERELDAVQRWLDDTDRIALRDFTVGGAFELKADGTPVTAADREIEQALRGEVERRFPGDAVLGEEQGASGVAARRWIVDPIDGTKNYRRGIPIFATLLALEHNGDLVLGVASAPALGARWWAVKGSGAFRNGEPIRVSTLKELSEAEVASGSLSSIKRAGKLEGFLRLTERAARQRGFGDFWGHMLVAQGSVDVMVEPEVSVWDLAAPKAILEEAGGRMTSLDGEDRIDAGHCLSTNGVLHDEVLGVLRKG